jgi:hypothetical protein
MGGKDRDALDAPAEVIISSLEGTMSTVSQHARDSLGEQLPHGCLTAAGSSSRHTGSRSVA